MDIAQARSAWTIVTRCREVGEGVVVAETVVEGINQHRHKIQNLIDFMYTIRTFKGKKEKINSII